MDKNTKKLAEIFNLSAYEARLYTASLGLGPATLTNLAKESQIPRTAAYPPLQMLLKRGFLAIIKIGKRKHYKAIQAKNLKSILDRKKIALEEIIAELPKEISSDSRDLQVTYYPGFTGIEAASDIFLENAKTSIGKSFENIDESLEKMSFRQFENYIDRRVKKNIKGRIIMPGNIKSPYLKKLLEKAKGLLLEVVTVSPNTYPIESSIAILDDMTLIIVFKDNPFAVLIKNKYFAKTMNSIHDMTWDRYII